MMADSCVMEIERIVTEGKIGSFFLPNMPKMDVLNTEWITTVAFHQPLGFKRNLRPTLRNTRARFRLRCKGLQREVLVVGKITIKNCNYINAFRCKDFQHLFGPEDNSFVIDVKLWGTHLIEIPAKIEIKGELSFRVSPENYFFFKFAEGYLPCESDIKDCQLHLAKELKEDLNGLYEKQEFADVLIHCGKEEFKAHKVILCSRSPVFSKMFSTQMKESKENLVTIDNLTPTVLKIMLKYIYCGVVQSLDDSTVGELLAAAEEYELSGLKKVCLYFLQSNLSVDNALCTLAYANLYDSNLKSKTIEFICKEYDNLKNTESWQKFHNDRPALESEILFKMIEFAKLGTHCAEVLNKKTSAVLNSNNAITDAAACSNNLTGDNNAGCATNSIMECLNSIVH